MGNISGLITIAKFSVLEAIRDKFILFMITGLLIIFLLSLFVGELAITEGVQVKTAVLAYTMRLFLVFACSLFVITSMLREFNDKSFELILSHPLPRSTYYFGKFAGFSFVCIFLSLISLLLLFIYVQDIVIVAWSFSLMCELLVIVAMSLLCLFTLNSLTISFSVVIAFYILSRSIEVIHIMSNSPILITDSVSHEFISWCINIISYVIPDLFRFTQTLWLIEKTGYFDDLVTIVFQTIIYCILLLGAALFDLYRKEL